MLSDFLQQRHHRNKMSFNVNFWKNAKISKHKYFHRSCLNREILFFFNFYFYFMLLYNTVLVLPYTDMNQPQVYEFRILNPPPTSHPISSLWIIPVHQPQASCIEHRLAIRFLRDSIHVSMP